MKRRLQIQTEGQRQGVIRRQMKMTGMQRVLKSQLDQMVCFYSPYYTFQCSKIICYSLCYKVFIVIAYFLLYTECYGVNIYSYFIFLRKNSFC
ncbi:unnamed protein product [Gadus morhua 'NCC']